MTHNFGDPLQLQPLILIPARYRSTRFPGKPLAKIQGKPMIDHVYDGCAKTGWKVFVVTDSEEIEKHLKNQQKNVLRVDDEVRTGSERIALAVQNFLKDEDFSFVLNVQGDEPLIQAQTLRDLVEFHQNSHFNITTLVKERSDQEGYQNPSIVKAIFSKESGQCLSFTRSSTPYYPDLSYDFKWWQHVGVYSYKKQALLDFFHLPSSNLERIESLEQLRALENGMTIGALTTDMELIGVDHPEDIKEVEERLS